MKKGKMILDICVGVVALAVLLAISFFWECSLDYRVTIFGVVLVVFSTIMLVIQDNNKE